MPSTEPHTFTDREHAVNRHASAIMVMIAEAQDEGMIPVTVSSFSDLHSYCDANDFAVEAGLIWGMDEATDALINDVETEVSRRLAVLAGGAPSEDDCSVCGKFLYRDGTTIAVHWATPFTATYRATSCTDECSQRIENARNAERVLSVANVRAARKLYLIETRKG